MISVHIEVDGTSYDGHAARLDDGSLRLISRYGSRNIVTGETPLPFEIQAEMALAEIVAQLRAGPAEPVGAPSDDLENASRNAPLEGMAGQENAARKAKPSRFWARPALSWAG